MEEALGPRAGHREATRLTIDAIYVAVAYGIQIQTGTGPYRWLSGWDATYPTMREAQEAQSRANAQEGWSARIVVLNTEAE